MAAQPFALADVSKNGVLAANDVNIKSVTHNGVGEYCVKFDNTGDKFFVTAFVNVRTAGVGAAVTTCGPQTVEVQTTSLSSGNPVDAPFQLIAP